MKGKFVFGLKLAAAALLAVAIAGLLMPFIVRFILPPERLRALIVAEARKSLHRDVRLGGVTYALFRGFNLEDVAVSENPDFTAGTFASARSFHLKVRWSALLRRRLVVESVAAEGVKVTITAEPSGGYNFSDIAASTGAAGGPAPAAAEAANPFDMRIRNARVASGEFIYKDAASGDQWRLWQIDAVFGRARPNGPFDAQLSFKGTSRTGGRPVPVALSYAGQVDLRGRNPHGRSLTVENSPWITAACAWRPRARSRTW